MAPRAAGDCRRPSYQRRRCGSPCRTRALVPRRQRGAVAWIALAAGPRPRCLGPPPGRRVAPPGSGCWRDAGRRAAHGYGGDAACYEDGHERRARARGSGELGLWPARATSREGGGERHRTRDQGTEADLHHRLDRRARGLSLRSGGHRLGPPANLQRCRLESARAGSVAARADLRNPLGAILMTAGSLLGPGRLREGYREVGGAHRPWWLPSEPLPCWRRRRTAASTPRAFGLALRAANPPGRM